MYCEPPELSDVDSDLVFNDLSHQPMYVYCSAHEWQESWQESIKRPYSSHWQDVLKVVRNEGIK